MSYWNRLFTSYIQKVTTTISLLAISAIVAGCASVPGKLSPELTSAYKRIGVISITAQSFSRQHVGLTVFGNEIEKIDSSSWEIDARYQQQLIKELSALSGFEFVSGNYSRAEFMRVYEPNGPWDAPAFRGPNWAAIEKPIKDYCAANKVNAVLTVLAVEGSDFLGGTNQTIRGAGIYTRGFGDLTRVSSIYLISGLALLDCQTQKMVAFRGLASSQTGWPGEILRASPVASLPIEISRTPLSRLSELQLAEIKASLIQLPKFSWAPTVKALFGK